MLGMLLVLILVLIPEIGHEVKGGRRWLRFGSIGFQPVELLKIVLIIYVAAYLERKQEMLSSFFRGLTPNFLVTGFFLFLILLQPDFGSVILIATTVLMMLYVGGGAGMAPMRSHLYQLFRTLKTGRKVTFWYGGRSKRELFYLDHFRALEKDFPNFKFYVALSEPLDEDNWTVKKDLDSEGDGFLGFIHQCVIDFYLSKHDSPEDIEVYFCGPPMMNQAVEKMADDFGIPPENVRFDDFGG